MFITEGLVQESILENCKGYVIGQGNWRGTDQTISVEWKPQIDGCTNINGTVNRSHKLTATLYDFTVRD